VQLRCAPFLCENSFNFSEHVIRISFGAVEAIAAFDGVGGVIYGDSPSKSR